MPGAVEAEAFKVRRATPEPVIEAGAKAAVTPAGMPLAVRLTVLLNPPIAVTPIVEVAKPPAGAFTDAGFAESE